MGKRSDFFPRKEWIAFLLAVLLLGAGPVWAGEKDNTHGVDEIKVWLSGSDINSIVRDYQANTKVYSTHFQENLLEDIAVSNRYLLETNLVIIDQNREIIRLLEESQKK